jgi:glucan biosynthesis protein
MNDDVISMANKMNDGSFHTPKQALEEAISEIGKSGAFKEGKKVLVLALDDNGGYNISFIQAGMKMSECVSLCEVAKTLFLGEMDYI